MADTSDGQFQKQGRGSERRDGPGSAGAASVGNAEQPGLQERVGRRSDPEPHGGSLAEPLKASRLFPPGPGDRAGWAELLRETPWLAPAIESGVRVSVDGVAFFLDQSRTDQLRAGGNGVVSVCGAAALIELKRRAGR